MKYEEEPQFCVLLAWVSPWQLELIRISVVIDQLLYQPTNWTNQDIYLV